MTFTAPASAGGVYVSTERNNGVSGISRPAILRFDPNAAGHHAHRDQRLEPHR